VCGNVADITADYLMKKANRISVSKSAWNIAKNYPNGTTQNSVSELEVADGTVHLTRQSSLMEENNNLQRMEDEVMGEISNADSHKSMIMERNLNQMVEVLHLRLEALETAARVRLEFCAEDLMPNSRKESKMAPKIMEEFEDQHVNPRILLKDMRTNATQMKVFFIHLH
jgi:hypothetical protein